jgi:sterol 3beta-glucosyltransferase
MRIAVIALGSRGDVQPYVALAKGLNAAGHQVRLLSHENFAGLTKAHGLEFCPMYGNVQEIVESPEMRALLEKGNFLAITRYSSKEAKRATIQWAETGLVACQGMDLLLAGVGGLFLGLALAEKLGIPFLPAYVFPFTATRAFPGVLFPQSIARFGGIVNWLSHQVVKQILWQGSRAQDAAARRQVLRMPAAPFFGPQPNNRYPTLYGFSSAVISKPTDWKNTVLTGYWFLEAASDWTPPLSLMKFLEAGKPPVYIGFGSMGSRNPEATANLVLQAVEKTGQRAILMSGWGGLQAENVPDSVYLVDSVPHDWLFPRMAAVVHHGGAGTTAAGLRAGVPTVIIPFFGDQGFWGQRVKTLGVGTAPIPRKKLTVEKLAQAIQMAVSDPVMRQQAASLGAKIRNEDGIAKIAAIIHEIDNRKGA